MELSFLKVLVNVGVLIALCIPGYVLRKLGKIKEGTVSSLVAVLIFVCQPLLSVTSFQQVQYSPSLLANMGIVFAGSLGIQLIVFIAVKLIYSRFRIPLTMKIAAYRTSSGLSGKSIFMMGRPMTPQLGNTDAYIYTPLSVSGMRKRL